MAGREGKHLRYCHWNSRYTMNRVIDLPMQRRMESRLTLILLLPIRSSLADQSPFLQYAHVLIPLGEKVQMEKCITIALIQCRVKTVPHEELAKHIVARQNSFTCSNVF